MAINAVQGGYRSCENKVYNEQAYLNL